MNGFHAQSNEDFMNSDSNSRYSHGQFGTNASNFGSATNAPYRSNSPLSRNQAAERPAANVGPTTGPSTQVQPLSAPVAEPPAPKPVKEPNSKLAGELAEYNKVAERIRLGLTPEQGFEARCRQAFDLANDLFGHAPTWVCFYRELMAGSGIIPRLFSSDDDFGAFLRTDQYHQIQLMLTALRSRDLPENDPNDPQRMITVRLPKSLHEAMCDEAGRLNISVNRLCISRMLQLLDPKMIPDIASKPRGRKPRSRQKQES